MKPKLCDLFFIPKICSDKILAKLGCCSTFNENFSVWKLFRLKGGGGGGGGDFATSLIPKESKKCPFYFSCSKHPHFDQK